MPGGLLQAQLSVLRAAASDVWQGRWPKSYAFTFVAELGVLLGGLVTLKIAGDTLGPTGFGEYAVARRAVSLLTFPLLLGLGISIPRYVSLTVASDPSGKTAAGYSLASLCIGVPLVTTFGLAGLIAPTWFAGLFYGDPKFGFLTGPILLAISGLYAHTLVYANFRGRLRMWPANLLQLGNLAVAPAVAVLTSRGNAAGAIRVTGILWLVTSAATASWSVLRRGFQAPAGDVLKKATLDLLTFGAPRVVGEFALFGFFALPTFYVAHTVGVEGAGLFSFALSLVQVLSSMFAAVGILLLPYISRQVATGSWERIGNVVSKSLAASLLVTLVAVAVLEIMMGSLIPWVMGRTFAPAVVPARWLVAGALPFVAYTLLRDPLDAIAVWPYNTINLGVTLLGVMAALWFGNVWFSPAPAVALGMLLLGALTVLAWRRALRSARAGPGALVGTVGGGSELGV